MNMRISQHKNQYGLSLVEILVSMVISIFLLGGVVQVYSGNKASYGFSEAMSRIQENGRFAMDTMTRDLRMVGFWGCAIFDPLNTSNISNNLDPNGANYDDFYDFINDPAIQGIEENEGLNDSDTFVINGPAPAQTNTLPPYNSPTSANIFVTATDAIAIDDIVLLSNCKGADIFQITNLTQGGGAAKLAVVHNTGGGNPGNYNPGNCTGGNAHCLSQTYGGDSSLLKLQKVTYTIEEGESGEPALFRTVFDIKSELVDGIEQMQILYGLNTDDKTDNTTPNQYLSSENINNDQWVNVTTVRVMLLVKSSTNASLSEPQKYRFNGENLISDDGRLRQVFSTTIALRNRIKDVE